LKLQRHHDAGRRAVGREAGLPDRSSLLLARPFLAAGTSPSQQLARKELARRVRQAMGQLSETDREILLMRNIEELPYEEIGCLLDLSASAARKRYGRALLRWQQILTDEGLLESSP
jgi:RNA polymerase sigma-70 factor (ECF subfamily)